MIAWFARNGVAANLLMISIVFLGLLNLKNNVPLEVFPSFETDIVRVSTTLRGASPLDIEKGLTIPIEEALETINGIKEIISRSSEGVSVLNIEVDSHYEADKVFLDIKNKVDSVNNLPVDADRPVSELVERNREVISMALYGNYDAKILRDRADLIKAELTQLPQISRVSLEGALDFEISIEVSQQKLSQYQLSLQQIANKINDSSIDLSAGFLNTASANIGIRTRNQAYSADDFANIVIQNSPDGGIIYLKDIAKINDGFGETQTHTRFNNQPAIMIDIYRTGQESAISVADAVKQYARKKRASLPQGMQMGLWNDRSKTVKARLNTLASNALQGGILVLVLLSLFLRPAIAFWVFLGIPVSFIGSFIVLGYFDVSLNLISLFGYILVLGIVVDDAIVTGENIYSHIRKGKHGIDAAIDGTHEISKPVLFGVLTTVVAFSPLFFIEGVRGAIFAQIPAVVVPVLLFSLIESKLILPAHLSHLHPLGDVRNRFGKFQQSISLGLENFVKNYYLPVLKQVLKYRYLALLVFISLLVISVGIIKGGQLRFSFFPKISSENVSLELSMPSVTPFAITDKHIEHISNSAYQLQKQYKQESGEDIILNILSISGVGGNENLGRVRFEIEQADKRPASIKVDDIVARWRDLIGEIPGAESMSIDAQIGRNGVPIDIELRSSDIQQLAQIKNGIKQKLSSISGVFDISDSLSDATKEFKLELLPRAYSLGLTPTDIARQVRFAFYGYEVQRFQRGRNEVSVFLRTPKTQRESINQLKNLPIVLDDGSRAPLQQLAKLSATQSPKNIYRIDRQRTLNIRADLDKTTTNLNTLLGDMSNYMDDLLIQYPNVTYSYKGEAKEQRESFSSLLIGLLAVLFIIYALLAIPFKSYLQPLIVMSVIPFGLIGAIWGHMLMGMNLAIFSLMGIMALIGILVNDSLVLVDYINKKKSQHEQLIDAIYSAAQSRFRPVILTSLTTFAGLLPLLFEKSTQAQFLIPMAVSLSFGILFATFITLLLVPMNYLFIEDIKRIIAKLKAKYFALKAE